MPPLEDIDDDGVFVILCTGGDDGERMQPLVDRVAVERVKIQALIDIEATVNVINMPMLRKMTARPVIRPTKARIYPYGSKMPLPL